MSKVFITAYTDYNPHEKSVLGIKASAIDSLFSNKEFNKEVKSLSYRPKRTSHTHDYHITKNSIDYAITTRRNLKRASRRAKEYLDNLSEPIENQYTTFRIPKASGGMRVITAPEDELKLVQKEILNLFNYSNILEHDSAFAYVEKRSIKDALEVHQANKSRWFLKIDLKDFFPTFTKEVIIETLNRLYPICTLEDSEVLEHVVEVSLYGGGLPQGSPLSPKLSNLCMVPFDHALAKKLWDYNKQHFVYTRYADDIIISSEYDFNYHDIVKVVDEMLIEVGLPHHIKHSKTRYGSSAGSNWNLGLMLNKDNDITIGYRKKQRIKATLHCYLADFVEHNYWDKQSVQEFLGLLNYAESIEPEYWEKRVRISEEKNCTTMQAANQFYMTEW